MKAAKREVYPVLWGLIGGVICTSCRYGNSCGSCGECYYECGHPLDDKMDFMDDGGPTPGDDCWGFRPSMKVSDIADIVGIVLENGWTNTWSFNTDPETNEIRVYGPAPREPVPA